MSKLYLLYCRKYCRSVATGLVLSGALPMSVLAQSQDLWTLEESIQRVVKVAPETRGAQAMVNASHGALQQAGAWPNPGIELRADNKIGKDDGQGGTDFTQFSVSQPLPLSGRINYQQDIARSELDSARAKRRYQFAYLEKQVAQRYHNLQLASELLRLAEHRLQFANELQSIGQRKEQAGELSNLERLRLDLIRESAQQIFDKTEGVYNEALNQFQAYLDLSEETIPQLTPLKPFVSIPVLKQLQEDFSKNAELLAFKHQVEAARSEVSLARANRLPDPVLRLYHEKDLLNGRRQNYIGIGIEITVPLWDRKNGRIDEAQAQVIKVQSELQSLERNLKSHMQQSFLHLNHLVEQGEHYRTRVFKPAQKVFDLTRKAYASGEVEILSLIDANNTYFETHERYLELLQEAWLEAAELRLATGRTLVTIEQDTYHE